MYGRPSLYDIRDIRDITGILREYYVAYLICISYMYIPTVGICSVSYREGTRVYVLTILPVDYVILVPTQWCVSHMEGSVQEEARRRQRASEAAEQEKRRLAVRNPHRQWVTSHLC